MARTYKMKYVGSHETVEVSGVNTHEKTKTHLILKTDTNEEKGSYKLDSLVSYEWVDE